MYTKLLQLPFTYYASIFCIKQCTITEYIKHISFKCVVLFRRQYTQVCIVIVNNNTTDALSGIGRAYPFTAPECTRLSGFVLDCFLFLCSVLCIIFSPFGRFCLAISHCIVCPSCDLQCLITTLVSSSFSFIQTKEG